MRTASGNGSHRGKACDGEPECDVLQESNEVEEDWHEQDSLGVFDEDDRGVDDCKGDSDGLSLATDEAQEAEGYSADNGTSYI